MKHQENLKKLTLNKETISNLELLSKEAQSEVIAGHKACWENLWTLYYCKIIWTGKDPEEVAYRGGI